MSEPTKEDEVEIVDVDTCSKKKSILLATGVTILLGLVPYSYMLLLGHYVLGGLAAAGHFASRYKISISFAQGAKLGAISAFLGMLVVYVAFPLWLLPRVSDEEWAQLTEQMVKEAYESGRPEVAEAAQNLFVPENVPMFLIGLLVAGTFASLLLGALGGGLGSAFFKKGPPAQ